MDAISVGVSDAINSAYSRALFWLIIKSLSLGINSSFIYSLWNKLPSMVLAFIKCLVSLNHVLILGAEIPYQSAGFAHLLGKDRKKLDVLLRIILQSVFRKSEEGVERATSQNTLAVRFLGLCISCISRSNPPYPKRLWAEPHFSCCLVGERRYIGAPEASSQSAGCPSVLLLSLSTVQERTPIGFCPAL